MPFATAGMIAAPVSFGLLMVLPTNFSYIWFFLLLADSDAGAIRPFVRGPVTRVHVLPPGEGAHWPIPVRNPEPHHFGVTYKATASYPYVEPDRAVAALRVELRLAAARDGAVPDWSTIRITGPTEVIGAHGVVCYEWTAAVDAQDVPAHYL